MGPGVYPRMSHIGVHDFHPFITLQWSRGVTPGCNHTPPARHRCRSCFNGAGVLPPGYHIAAGMGLNAMAELQQSRGVIPGCHSSLAMSLSGPESLQWSRGVIPGCNRLMRSCEVSSPSLQWSRGFTPGCNRTACVSSCSSTGFNGAGE